MYEGHGTYEVFGSELVDLVEGLDIPKSLLDFGRIVVELRGNRGKIDDSSSFAFLQ